MDDGVWAHLPAALALEQGSTGSRRALEQGGKGGESGEEAHSSASWDGLLVAHYLGVDHCGHSHGVGSPQMAAKLRCGGCGGTAPRVGGCCSCRRLSPLSSAQPP